MNRVQKVNRVPEVTSTGRTNPSLCCMGTISVARSFCELKPKEAWDKGMTLLTSAGLFQYQWFGISEFFN